MSSGEVRKFLMIKYHSDSDISAFLQSNAEQGLALKRVNGNYFYFVKKPYDGRRVCARSLYRVGNEFSTELQIREELTRIRKTGWDCITIGKQETLKDIKRHVYLIEEIKDSALPEINDKSEKKAEKRGKLQSLSNLALCAVYVAVVSLLFSSSIIKVVTNNLYIVFAFLFSLLLVLCSVICLWSYLDVFFIKKRKRLLDFATKAVSICLIAFSMFLIFDSVIQDRGQSDRVKIGASSYQLYHDSIPVNLDTLGLDTSAPYRTTRHMNSQSVLSEYSYNFDESFGIKEGETVYDTSTKQEVCFISYTVFTSPYEWLRNAVESQSIPNGAIRNSELEKELDADRIYSANANAVIIFKGDSIITIKSGIELNPTQLAKFVSLAVLSIETVEINNSQQSSC